ncbi:MAG: T9SS type A sorting domain-containing protein [Bacteroidetes bacterium]|nr:T9SS type A sorting domain-containing protein [Bacteroidota bacterium]
MKQLILAIFTFSVIFVAAQSGITWNTGANIAANSYSNMHPRIALDASGNPLVIWGRMNDESLWFSRWSGSAFTTPIKLNPTGVTVATASWMGPDIASKGDTVYVVYRQTPESMDTSKHIYILSSFDGGISFSSPVRIDNIGDSVTRFPTVTIDSNGNPIVAFMKFDNMFMNARWAVTRSGDHGSTFSPDVKASGWSGSTSEVCDCCPGVIVSSGNTTSIVYRDNLSNLRDMWSGISSDNGATFGRGFDVDNTNWSINFCPSSGPDAVIVGDSLYTVFMSGGSGAYRTYLSKSSISTGIQEYKVNLSDTTIPNLGQQNYPRIASDGKASAILWKQNIGGDAQLPILFTNNVAKGFPATYDTVDLGDITNADVAVANGKVFVVWEDDNSGTVKYRLGTFTPDTVAVSPNSITTISEKGFAIYPNPATDVLNISTPSNDIVSISIFNALGEKMYNAESLINKQVSIGSLSKGIYSILLTTHEKTYVSKFSKQ